MAQTSDKTKNMIEKQIDSRRTRHIKLITDFDNWKEKMYAAVAKNYSEIKIDSEEFLAKKDKDINQYWSEIKESYLLTREKEILEEITSFCANNENEIS